MQRMSKTLKRRPIYLNEISETRNNTFKPRSARGSVQNTRWRGTCYIIRIVELNNLVYDLLLVSSVMSDIDLYNKRISKAFSYRHNNYDSFLGFCVFQNFFQLILLQRYTHNILVCFIIILTFNNTMIY